MLIGTSSFFFFFFFLIIIIIILITMEEGDMNPICQGYIRSANQLNYNTLGN